MANKVRTSGLYLTEEMVEKIEAVRRCLKPIPSFNQTILRLLEQALKEWRNGQKRRASNLRHP